jgi:hypothetical protein
VLLNAAPALDDWSEIAEVLLALPVRAHDRAAAQRRAVAALVREAGGASAWLVPELPGGVRSIAGLGTLSAVLPPRPPELVTV